MIFRLIQSVDGQLIASEFTEANVVAAMEVRGYTFTGFNSNHRQRAELQGAPKFAGVCGPMWDGGALRYECREAYAQLSA